MPFVLSNIFSDGDHQKVVDSVEEFCKGKLQPAKFYSTTTIIIGVKQNPLAINGQQGGTPIFAVMTSCLVTWLATAEQKEEWEKEKAKQKPISYN